MEAEIFLVPPNTWVTLILKTTSLYQTWFPGVFCQIIKNRTELSNTCWHTLPFCCWLGSLDISRSFCTQQLWLEKILLMLPTTSISWLHVCKKPVLSGLVIPLLSYDVEVVICQYQHFSKTTNLFDGKKY